MKVAVLVCTLLALGLAQQPLQPFKGGHSYTYRFRTQVASSLIGGRSASDTPQQAITGLQAQVRLTFTNDRHARLQLEQIRVGELNADVQQIQQQHANKQLLLPNEQFEQRQLPEEVKQKLQLPLSVNLVDGVVELISFHENDDSVWSKNIKRAVLNMLQLNLKRNDVQGLKMESSQPQDEQQQKKLSVFTIPEITLEGECEVLYTIQKNHQGKFYADEEENSAEQQQFASQQQQHFNVTKNVNFDKCQRTADVTYGFQPNAAQQLRCLKCLRQAQTSFTATTFGQQQAGGQAEKQDQLKITQCQSECHTNQLNRDQNIERSTTTRYELVGQPSKYAIRRAQVVSQYVVKVQNPEAQNTISQVVAVSELVHKSNEQGQQVSSFKQASNPESLMYSNEWDLKERRFYAFGDEEFEPKQSPFARVQQKQEEAQKSVREIIKQWSEDKEMGYELNSALLFNKLVTIVRQSTLPELKSIESAVLQAASQLGANEKNSEEQAKSLFNDALAVAATRNGLKFLAEKIQQREMSTLKAAELVKIFTANQHSPSDRQADILERIADSEIAQSCPVLKQAAWLAYGQAVGRVCQQQPAQSQTDEFRVEILCPQGKKEQYKKALILQWKQAESVYDQILALKTIGNSALDKCMPELEKIIKDKRQPALIRMEAIDALRRLRTSIPEQIQQTLLPVFQDQRNPPEVRMAAVSMLLYTQPEPAILDQIVFSVQQDRSQNVRSFVLTALDTLSKSPSSGEQEIAQHLKAAMKIAKIAPEQIRSSRKYQVPIYSSEQENTEEQNVFLGLASIVSPANLFPVHLAASIRAAVNGDPTQEKIQLSFSQKDLEQLYEKFAYVLERYTENDDDNNQDNKASSEFGKRLDGLYTSMGIKSRRTGSYYLSSEESDDESGESKRSTKLGNNSPFGMIVIRTNDVDQMIVPVDEHKLPQLLRKFINGNNQDPSSDFQQLKETLARGKHFQQHIAINVGETKAKLPTSAGLPLAVMWQTSAVASAEGQIKIDAQPLKTRAQMNLQIRASAIATHVHRTEVWMPVVVSGVKSYRTIELNNGPLKVEFQMQPGQVEIIAEPPRQQKERIIGLHTLPATYTQKFKWESSTYGEARLRTVRNLPLEHSQREYHIEQQHQQPIRIEGSIHKPATPAQFLNSLYTCENNLHIYIVPSQKTPTQVKAQISGFLFKRTDEGEHSAPDFDDFYTPQSSSSPRRHFSSLYDDSSEEQEQDQQQQGQNRRQQQGQYDDDSDEQQQRHFRQSMQFSSNQDRQSKMSSFVDKYFSGKPAAYKHKLTVRLEAQTPSTLHRVEAAIQAQCDKHLQHCKATLNAHRTPMMENESENWQMKADVQTVAPENVRNEEEPDQKHSRMLIKANTQWGSASGKTSSVQVRLQGEPTRKSYWRSETSDKWSRFLNKFDLVAEYELRPAQKHAIQRVYELVKAKYFWQLKVNNERQGDQNTVRASLIIDPFTRRHANVTVQTPQERVRGEMIELPLKVQGMSLQRRPTSYQSVGQLFQGFTQASECKANDERIKTFDGVKYKAPMSECWSVLAKDCSRSDPRFAVLMKKHESEKRVKIITRDNEIELSKKSDGQQQIKIKVNGQQVTDEEQLSKYGIEKSDYEVQIGQRGVQVRFDGEEAAIKLSGTFKNVQCGLCGHYSDEEEDIFRTNDNRRSSNLKEFHRSFTVKHQECDEQKMNRFYEGADSSEFQIRPRKQQSAYFRDSFYAQDEDENKSSSEEENTQQGKQWGSSEESQKDKKIRPIDATKVLEYEHKVCFSSSPVKRCPRGSAPTGDSNETKQVSVQFFCLDRSTSQARRLQRQVRQGEIVSAAEHKLSFVDNVEEPLKCQSNEDY